MPSDSKGKDSRRHRRLPRGWVDTAWASRGGHASWQADECKVDLRILLADDATLMAAGGEGAKKTQERSAWTGLDTWLLSTLGGATGARGALVFASAGRATTRQTACAADHSPRRAWTPQ